MSAAADIYSKVYEFCGVKNNGTVLDNGAEPTPRVKWICGLLESLGIEHRVDRFLDRGINCYNVILPTQKKEGVRVITAHHDIVNPLSDNANDNSASVINAIATKILFPDALVVLTDGEEFGGKGAQRLSTQILAGEFGQIDWILNFELTGKGGETFFVGSTPNPSVLLDLVVNEFNCPIYNVPFNDSWIFRRNGIDSIVINPLPLVDGELDMKMLYNCHTLRDSVDTIDPADMQAFVERVVVPILSLG